MLSLIVGGIPASLVDCEVPKSRVSTMLLVMVANECVETYNLDMIACHPRIGWQCGSTYGEFSIDPTGTR